MKLQTQLLSTAIGIIAGSLLADVLFGDGIQDDDIARALLFAVVGVALQYLRNSKRPSGP